MNVFWPEDSQNTTISTSCILLFLFCGLMLSSCAGLEQRETSPPAETQENKQEEVPKNPTLEDLRGYLVPES